MAASQITVQQINFNLTETTEACNVDGNFFTNNGEAFIHIINGSGGSLTVTVDSPQLCNQGSTHDLAVAVPAGEERMIGPFDPKRFNDDDGYVQLTYSGVTSLTIAVLKLR